MTISWPESFPISSTLGIHRVTTESKEFADIARSAQFKHEELQVEVETGNLLLYSIRQEGHCIGICLLQHYSDAEALSRQITDPDLAAACIAQKLFFEASISLEVSQRGKGIGSLIIRHLVSSEIPQLSHVFMVVHRANIASKTMLKKVGVESMGSYALPKTFLEKFCCRPAKEFDVYSLPE